MSQLSRRHVLASLAAGLTPLTHAQPAGLEAAARAEGRVASVGMPDDWANWRATWADLQRLYGLAHVDTDMSSAEQIAKIEAERANASIDIGDVGFEFGPIAKARGITRAYKPSTWAQVPDWAKDADGHWALAYTGTIAFAVNKRLLKDVPRSWKALFAAQPRVMIGAVGRAAQATQPCWPQPTRWAATRPSCSPRCRPLPSSPRSAGSSAPTRRPR